MNNTLNSFIKNYFLWYLFALFAIFIFIYFFTKDITLPLFITAIGFIGSIICLLSSKIMAKYVHKIKIVTLETGGEAAKLYELVEKLAQKANLPKTPEIGIYKSPDCNAFSTGFSQSNSLVAFSDTLLKTFTSEEIEAVAAHEVSHIANYDMLGTVIIEGTVRSIFYFIKFAFIILGVFFAFFSYSSANSGDQNSAEGFDMFKTMSAWLGIIISTAIMLFGKLISLFYSRHREYKADANAALLTSPEAMISALQKLAQDENETPISQTEFSCFKITNRPSFLEILSTHPAIEKRIAALKEQDSETNNDTPLNN